MEQTREPGNIPLYIWAFIKNLVMCTSGERIGD